MKFGREFRIHLDQTLPEWRAYFLRYKLLKKLLNSVVPAAGNLPPPLPEFQVWFVSILTGEIEKFNDFYVGKEEDLIIRFQAVNETIERVKERDYAVVTSQTEYESTMEVNKDLVAIHGEMVLLKSYSSLNFAGLIKILKKYDKRTGAMLTIPFTQLAFHQPFFTTEPLTRLIHECEAKLEALFPLEAEVVESSSIAVADDTIHHNRSSASSETALLVVEETGDIYRSTLAAISTIEGLKKPSSTYNDLSMSYLFGKRGVDGTGDLTAENSPCNSLVSRNDEEDGMEEDTVCSPLEISKPT